LYSAWRDDVAEAKTRSPTTTTAKTTFNPHSATARPTATEKPAQHRANRRYTDNPTIAIINLQLC